jgi:putative membrane protein
LKPILVLFTLPATILSLGIFLLFINAAIIKVAAWLIGSPGFVVDGWGWAILFSLLLSILNSVLEKVVKPAITPKESDTKVYDKDGNRIA